MNKRIREIQFKTDENSSRRGIIFPPGRGECLGACLGREGGAGIGG